MLRLVREIEHLRRGQLHPRRQLVGADPSLQARVARALGRVSPVQVAERGVGRALGGRAEEAGRRRGAEVGDRVFAARPDDRALVRRMLAGEDAAFEEFFAASFQGLYRFALVRVGHDADLARDVAQAAICKGIERLATYRGEAPLFSWLCSICRFEITGHFRRLGRRPQ